MKKRTKLSDRVMPVYSRGEERMNMITHIVGGGLGVMALFLCVGRAAISFALSRVTKGVFFIIGSSFS